MVIKFGPLTIMSSPILMLDGANNNSTLKQMTIKESIKIWSIFFVWCPGNILVTGFLSLDNNMENSNLLPISLKHRASQNLLSS